MYEALSYGTAATHLAFVLVLVGGAWVVYRQPSLVRFHLPAVLAMAVVSIAGMDCPLTTLENYFRDHAGWQPYENGFISHYLVEPIYGGGITPLVRVFIIMIWVVPNALAYYAAFVAPKRRLVRANSR